jgi:uncharacterized protein YebE (UPF0316 family)
LLPLVIFFAEMCVVTLGTLRIIFISRGNKVLAPLLGFFEVLMWLFAISAVMQNLDNGICFIAFALGFTLGNFWGILIEKKLALGMAIVRIITNRPAHALVEQLRSAHFGVTSVEGRGSTGPVQIVMTVVKRRQLDKVFDLIETHHPNAFYAVDELQSASDGIFPQGKSWSLHGMPSALKSLRFAAHGLAGKTSSRED